MSNNLSYINVFELSKSFQMEAREEIKVIDNISLNVKEGEILSIIGPSGCGKTTLLRLIGGLIQPNSGNIRINGNSPQLIKGKRNIGFMFQYPILLEWLNVTQNILLPLQIEDKRIDYALLDKVNQIIKMVGLEEFARAYPNELSGGMQSRTALARALIIEPKLLLLDEPFGALDALSRVVMQELLLRVLEYSRATVIIVTHSIEEAILLSDRVAILSKRPCRIRVVQDVQLSKPRDEELRYTNGFIKLRKTIRDYILKE